VTADAARRLAALLTEDSPTQAAGFKAYYDGHIGTPLRTVEHFVDRTLGEVARAVGVHRLDVVALHARWVGKTLSCGKLGPFTRDFAESFVARVIAERAGILESRVKNV
jgi:hypothetical protein